MKESILKNKSYEFDIKIVLAYKLISSGKNEFIISKQL